jgi:ferredoxin
MNSYLVFHDSDVDIPDEEITPGKCSVCNIRAFFSWPDLPFGIRCKNHKSPGMVKFLSAEQAGLRFIKQIEALGGRVVGKYVNGSTHVECICKQGHQCFPTKESVDKENRGICKKCVNVCPVQAREKFEAFMKEKGITVIGKYINANAQLECICPNGHTYWFRPKNISGAKGSAYRKCTQFCPEKAKEKFIHKVTHELKAQIIGEYVNAYTEIKCICRNGHLCTPKPRSVNTGNGICSICRESRGERICGLVLDSIFSVTSKAREYKILPHKYRYDWFVQLNCGTKVLIEYHGTQHDKHEKRFHPEIEGFIKQRRKDLNKVKIAMENGYKLIVLDHRWSKKPQNEWIEYLEDCFDSEKRLIADADFHQWVFEYENIEESISKLAATLVKI